MKTILVDAVDCFVNETGLIFQEMYDLLETFPNQKIIVTNGNLDRMPYKVFTLKHNPEKTGPKYFELMLDHFGLTKNDVIYFEHNPAADHSAESIGIKSHYYDSQNKDLISLKKFLLESAGGRSATAG